MSTAAVSASAARQELHGLIRDASTGDRQKVERLITPLLTPDERLVWCAPSAKLGVIPTYNFAFVTDRRVGDVQVTPFTGNLHVEICYLQHIDGYAMIQPAISIWLWVVWVLMYLLSGVIARRLFMFFVITMIRATGMGKFWDYIPFFVFLSYGVFVAAIVATHFLINPWLIRLYLRFKKSGLWLKLYGSHGGQVIFADRNRFGTLAEMCRAINEQKMMIGSELS